MSSPTQLLLALGSLLAIALPALHATPKLYYTPTEISTGLSNDPYNPYGSSIFTQTVLDTFGAANVLEVTTFENTADFADASALFINARVQTGALSTLEQANILAFINAGGAVFFVGEHTGWTSWDNSFLGLFGDHVETWGTPVGAANATAAAPAGLPGTISYLSNPGRIVGGNSTPVYDLYGRVMAGLYGPNNNAFAFLDSTPFANRAYDTIYTGVATWIYSTATEYEASLNSPPSVPAVPDTGVTGVLALTLVALAGLRRSRAAA